MQSRNLTIAILALCASVALSNSGRADSDGSPDTQTLVTRTIQPLMQRYGIPGMSVGLAVGGRIEIYNYGVTSKATGKLVANDTLFEIGSVSKTFTATLASYAQVTGHLSLSDSASKYLEALRGSAFDHVSLLNLGTHTPGGMPLQLPDEVTDDDQLMRYFQNWKPTYAPGTHRTYANPSIGMLGLIAAKSLNADFHELVANKIFHELGMSHSFFDVPLNERKNYAQGYTTEDVPIRVKPAVLDAEAYGVKTTAMDLMRFVEANMGMIEVRSDLQDAILKTHTGYYKIGPMTQDLIWEQYPYPADLKDLRDGNSARMAGKANPAVVLDPPSPPRDNVFLNKTGSTNGFGAYVAFIPKRQIGIVLLANKNYPIDARVTTAHMILTHLDEGEPSNR
jgi:beta-lactamase class C